MVLMSCGAVLGQKFITADSSMGGVLERTSQESALWKHTSASKNNGGIYCLTQSKMRHRVQVRLKWLISGDCRRNRHSLCYFLTIIPSPKNLEKGKFQFPSTPARIFEMHTVTFSPPSCILLDFGFWWRDFFSLILKVPIASHLSIKCRHNLNNSLSGKTFACFTSWGVSK